MFEYQICNIEDEEIFFKQCKALENNIPNLYKSKLIECDIQLQIYELNGKEILVFNDDELGVYIKSEVDLIPYFKK